MCSKKGSFDEYLQKGKMVFNIEDPTKEAYKEAIKNLEKAIKINPNDAEAHYFLGYAYSRLNSFDGRTIDKMNIDLVLKTSEQFENVNKLTPKYTGEIIVLDPYSKLTGEWGSLSLRYFATNKTDSMLWACNEGRKRGGFSDYYLGMARIMLDNCTEDAFLFSSGDNATLPLWYLQKVEKYRTDVKVIDLNLLNSSWYPKMLEEKESVDFGFPPEKRDTLDYCYLTDLNMSILNKKDRSYLSWEFDHDFLYRGDRLFLNLLQKNAFEKDVYFSYGFDPKSILNLEDYLQDLIILNRINYDNSEPLSADEYLIRLKPIINNIENINYNSPDQISDVDRVRFYICCRIMYCIDNKKIDEANNLMHLFETNKYFTQTPIQSENTYMYIKSLKERLSE